MAEEKNTSIFRKKSVEYIDSPEKLDQYLRVTSPGVWALLGTVVLLLMGVIVWGIFGELQTDLDVAVVTDNGETYCYVPEDKLKDVVKNPYVIIGEDEYDLNVDEVHPTVITDDTNAYILVSGNLESGNVVYEMPVDCQLKDGVYAGTIITETIAPINLLLD